MHGGKIKNVTHSIVIVHFVVLFLQILIIIGFDENDQSFDALPYYRPRKSLTNVISSFVTHCDYER